MRLLYFQGDGSLAFANFERQKPPPYAILSHTWGDEEVTLQDLTYGISNSLTGFRKIAFCGEQAAKDGLKYFWVDTCCIDKSNLPELTKSINSMFRWYRNAAKCYVYLTDVSTPDTAEGGPTASRTWMAAFKNSRWFTRGWTLQELIAPPSVDFFSKDKHFLGDKLSLEDEIASITNIPVDALRGRPLAKFSVAERFSWADGRETTEEEDIAYCLLGIFDVFMPLIYGEGEVNAVKRLQRLIGDSLHDQAIGRPEDMDGSSESTVARPSGSRKRPGESKASERMKAYVLRALGTSRALTWKQKPHRGPDAQLVLNHWHRAHSISQEIAQGANAGSIFQEAHVLFLNDVFWDEWPGFQTFADHEEMMTDIRNYCEGSAHSLRLLRACKSVEVFSLRWTHFFRVVELAMSVDPEWPRTLWGAIRLIFVRCRSYVNMFEKLALMFEKIRDRLPSYQDQVLRLRKDCPEALKKDLGKVLAIVYADILQFCHDACTMFRASPVDISPEVDLVKSLIFIPFTVSYDDMLERLAEHKRLFDISLRAGKQKDLTVFLDRIFVMLEERNEYMHEEPIKRNLRNEKAIHDRNFQESVHRWIRAPDYQPDYDKAKGARSFSSGAWLQGDPAYVSWRREICDTDLNAPSDEKINHKHSKPILWLEGPAGYGKTVLSTVIIEDLQQVAASNSDTVTRMSRNKVAYFYFNAQLPGKQTCSDALRAIAVQIFESLKDDPIMTDILCLSMLEDIGNESTASDDDLVDLLKLSVRRLLSLAVVIDGVDECRDFGEMWPFLGAACDNQKFRCVLLGRHLPSVPSEQITKVLPQSLLGKNRRDIWHYLHQETLALQQAGYLSNELHAPYVADTLSSRAESKFLWANLIMSYLWSRLLSPTERVAVIEDSKQLETLHGVYAGILRQYEVLFFEERSLLTKILQFLVLSKEPLSVEQLNIAISTKPGQKLENSDLFPDFEGTLLRLCGKLIQISGSTILFSHLSFRAFLQSQEAIDLKSPFRVNVKAGSLQFAVICLSHLVHHLPEGPLGGEAETAINQADLTERLPFSRYSAQHWVHHAAQAIRLIPGTPRELITDCYHLMRQLGSFMSKRAVISAWIEVCWTYGFPASIAEFWSELETRLSRNKISAQRDSTEWRIFESLGKMKTLSEELRMLNEHWSTLLLSKPYEIWGPSISVFLHPVSWAHNDDANITMIASDDAYEDLEATLLKVSKLSSCGGFLGVVRLSGPDIPREPRPPVVCVCQRRVCFCAQDASPVDLRGAVLEYQILEMKDNFPVIVQVSIDLDSEDLREVERGAKGRNFRFPIAFAPNIRRISILHTLYWIENDGSFQQQRISMPIIESVPAPPPPLPPNRRGWKGRGRRVPPRWSSANFREEVKQPRFYKFEFSPCGQYVAHLDRQNDMNPSSMGRWHVAIWKKHSTLSPGAVATSTPATWQKEAELFDIYSDFTRTGSFAFNPQFLQVALYEHTRDSPDQISIWNFGSKTPHTRMIYATGLLNIHISSAGRHLFGDHPCFENPRVVELDRYLKNAVPVPPPASEGFDDSDSLVMDMDPVDVDVDMADGSEDGFTHVIRNMETSLITRQPQHRHVLSANMLDLSASGGLPELRVVRRQRDGGVVLKHLSSAANASESLLYLPKSMGSSTSVSILDDRQQGRDTVRMVLTPDFQDSYTWDDPLNRQTASIITRPASSIKSVSPGASELASMPNSGAQRLLAAAEDSEWIIPMDES